VVFILIGGIFGILLLVGNLKPILSRCGRVILGLFLVVLHSLSRTSIGFSDLSAFFVCGFHLASEGKGWSSVGCSRGANSGV